MKQIKIIVIILFSIPGFYTMLYGQILLTKNFTIENGLASNNINSMCQDSSGYIWIASSEGLSKFDSKGFTNYTVEEGLPTNNFFYVLVDKYNGNKIWIGSIGKGVVQYYKGKFKSFGENLPAKNRNIECLFMDEKGRLWCGTDSSIYFIKNNKIVSIKNPLNVKSANSISEDEKGNILIGASNGFFVYNPSENKFIKKNLPLKINDEISSVKYTGNGTILVLTLHGMLYQIKNGTIKSMLLSRIGSFYRIFKSNFSNIFWVTSDHGLFKIDNKNFRKVDFYNKKNGLQSDNVICLLNDREGVLWLGTNGKGIIKILYTNLIRFNIPESVKDVYDVETVIDKNGHIWIIKSDKLFELWHDKNSLWHRYVHIKLTVHSTGSLSKLSLLKGTGLIVTYDKGIVKDFNIINNNPDSKLPSKLVLSSYANLMGKFKYYQVFLAFRDKAGYLWVSATQMGIVVFSKSKPEKVIKVYTNKNGLLDNSILCIYQDKQGNYWFGGYDKGLTYFSLDKVKKDLGLKYDKSKVKVIKYTVADGLPNNSVRAITEDDSGRMYIGTRYGGIAILQNGKFKIINKQAGLLSNGIWDIKAIPGSGVWLATQSGVQKINFNGTISNELKEDLPKIPFYSIAYNKNKIVFANPTEIFIYEPGKNYLKNIRPPVYIKEILVNGRQYPIKKRIELSTFQNNISFEFISITNKEENRTYEYRLVNKDKNWNKIANTNWITYASLSPGSYKFQVASINPEGLRNISPAEISFKIDAPFYIKWWFDLLVLSLIILTTVILLRLRIKRLLEIEAVRKKIASELHDQIGAGLTKIAILSEHALFRTKPNENKTNLHKTGESSIVRVGAIARNLVDQMQDVIWSIDPKYDKLEDFIIHFKNYAFEVCEAKDISLKIKTDNINNIKLNSNIKRKLQLISTEALNNSLKHSCCSEINYTLNVISKVIYLVFTDNGIGFNYNGKQKGNGLFNMKKHVEELKGIIKIESQKEIGTVIKIQIPLKK